MNYDLLNEMIEYIEKNLDSDIEYKKLARIVGVNEFILQRIFMFITEISLSEYIRKRKLSKAYEELMHPNNKIIDIALKYGYASHVSFSRAFKKEFGIVPSKINNKSVYKMFPKIIFGLNDKKNRIINYEIKEIEGFKVYGKKISAENSEDLRYKIRQLYKEIKKDGSYEWYNKHERYAMSYYPCQSEKVYIVGSKYEDKTLESFTVRSGKYAIFDVGSLDQVDIKNKKIFIREIWCDSTILNMVKKPCIECYKNNNCYIFVPLYK